ncbi:FAD/FMN-containing dehydrogenase [Aspergillus alliaceus]|uniref:FAD/FMN-containing dehydrogenase n=1 Tax=Petromyces alliaceus TaxID=209559 RepID=A0A5N7CNC0_PETAA|nr:FAD/FMN-containing dehydrogenase [Aspergillus alliaceus]
MGNTASVAGHGCLVSAVAGNSARVQVEGGPLLGPNGVHPYNLNFPVKPVAVTFPETSKQVADIVKCATEYGYKVQARSGGHSYGNYGLGGMDGAVVVDMKNFKQFSMNKNTYTATIGPGLSMRELDMHLYNSGKRAMAHGICPGVGVGGHLTIGGKGPTSRQWGLALDHIEEIEIVLSNYSIVKASDSLNPDIFFAVKGAAASYGVVTEFKVRTEPAQKQAVQYSYTINLGSITERARLLRDWQAFVADPQLTRKFAGSLIVFPKSIVITGIFYGTKDEYDSLGLEERFPKSNPGNIVILTDSLAMTTNAVEDVVLGITTDIPWYFYSKSIGLSRKNLIPPSGMEDILNYLDGAPVGLDFWFVTFDLVGGAVNDYATNSTGYPHREILIWVDAMLGGIIIPTTKPQYDFLDGFWHAVIRALPLPESDVPVYPGYVDPRLPNAQRHYWGPNLERLGQIKAAVDPDDVFHNPQGVQVGRT